MLAFDSFIIKAIHGYALQINRAIERGMSVLGDVRSQHVCQRRSLPRKGEVLRICKQIYWIHPATSCPAVGHTQTIMNTRYTALVVLDKYHMNTMHGKKICDTPGSDQRNKAYFM